MAGFVTSSRHVDIQDALGHSHGPLSWYEDRFGTRFTGPDVFGLGSQWATIPLQTTTSFRTKGRDDDWFPTGSSLVDFSGKFFRNLHDEDLRRHGATRDDSGHEFDTRKQTVWVSHPHVVLAPNSSIKYVGPLIPDPAFFDPVAGSTRLPEISFDDSVLNARGNRLLKRAEPTHPATNLLSFLGETYRDGFPLVPGRPRTGTLPRGKHSRRPRRDGYPIRHGTEDLRQKRIRVGNHYIRFGGDETVTFERSNIGDEFLNVEFGWAPFIRDLRSTLHAVVHSRSILEQYARDSGAIVRRSRRDRSEKELLLDSTKGGQIYDPVNSSVSRNLKFPLPAGRSGSLRQIYTRHSEYRFSGAFSYYLENGVSAVSRITRYEQLAQHVLGFELTPEVLWELTPWSWLVDWFFDIGNLIHSVSSSFNDGLVVRWGYMTVNQTDDRQCTLSGYRTCAGNLGDLTVGFVQKRTRRIRSTPFGFGWSFDGLTNRQAAILVALGIAKTPKIAY